MEQFPSVTNLKDGFTDGTYHLKGNLMESNVVVMILLYIYI